MRGVAGYNSALQQHLFEEVQREVPAGAKDLEEQRPRAVTMAKVEEFTREGLHRTMLERFPLTTATATAACARPNSSRSFLGMLERPTTPDLGGSGEPEELNALVGETVSRLVGKRCPRSVTSLKTMKTLQSQVEMTPARVQKRQNRLGDTYSKSEGKILMEKVAEDADEPMVKMKRGVEDLWQGTMATAGPRRRKAQARREGVTGHLILADNVDWVRKSLISSQ